LRELPCRRQPGASTADDRDPGSARPLRGSPAPLLLLLLLLLLWLLVLVWRRLLLWRRLLSLLVSPSGVRVPLRCHLVMPFVRI